MLVRLRTGRHGVVRARLIDGIAADVRSRRCRDGPIHRRWTISPSAATTRGVSTWRATAAPTRHATSIAISPTAPTIPRPRPTTSCKTRGVKNLSGLRHFVGRACARRCSRSAIRSASRGSRSTLLSGPAKAARRSRERRKKLPQFLEKKPAARSTATFVQTIFNRDHPGTRRAKDGRGIRRCGARARRFGADRHLRRHVLEAACGGSARNHGADDRSCAANIDGIAGFDDLIEFFKRCRTPTSSSS